MALTAVFVMLTLWSWLKWADPLIDFGREVYTPWQLASGRVLYRDVASLFGPFSQYFNAALFQLFGTSIRTLFIANLIILAAVAYGIHHLVAASCDRVTASWATLTTLTVFGFSQHLNIGNYNFIAPYSHEATHSIALAIGVIVSFYHGIRTRRIRLFSTAGVLFGCLLLTKVETSVAMIGAIGVMVAAWWLMEREPKSEIVPRALAFFGCALIPPLAFWMFLSRHMAPWQVLQGVGSWSAMLISDATQNEFYMRVSGFQNFPRHVIRMSTQFFGFMMFVGLTWQLDNHWPRLRTYRLFHVRAAAAVARISLLLSAFILVPWDVLPTALPLITACSAATLAVMFYRQRHNREAALRLFPQLVWAVFSLGLLAKILLNVRLYHYGFYLALPATILLVMMLIDTIPSLMAGRGAHGAIFRAMSILMLIAGIGMHFAISNAQFANKRYSVGSGWDRLLAVDTEHDWQARAVNDMVSRIQTTVPQNATMVVFPEGVMINYLSRRSNPTPYINFMLPEMRAFGESRILASLDAAAPDYAFLVDRDTREYGFRSFGSDPNYGQGITQWLDANYVSIATTGDRPVREGGSGIQMFRRKTYSPK